MTERFLVVKDGAFHSLMPRFGSKITVLESYVGNARDIPLLSIEDTVASHVELLPSNGKAGMLLTTITLITCSIILKD